MVPDDLTPCDSRLLRLSARDNVCVATRLIEAGTQVMIGGEPVTLPQRAGIGHKIAVVSIRAGEKVVKYGSPIGSATRDIAVGELVHTHNLRSDYIPIVTYSDHQSA